MSCVIIIVYYLFNHIWIMFNMKEFSADMFVILLNEVLCSLSELIVKIYFLLKTGDKLETLLSYHSTLNSPLNETSGCIKPADVTYARRLQIINICIACCILAVYLAIAYSFSEQTDLMHNMHIIIDLIILYANLVATFQINSELIFIYLLFYKLRGGLVKALSARLTNTRNAENVLTPISFVSKLTSTDIKQTYKQHYVSKSLQRLKYFHTITMKNFTILNRYFGSSLVNWCSLLSVILMINSYIIVTSCLNSVETNATTVISAVARFTIYVSTISVFFYHVQCIGDVVSTCYCLLLTVSLGISCYFLKKEHRYLLLFYSIIIILSYNDVLLKHNS